MNRSAALWALAAGAFGIGTTEYAMIGLLPQISADFGVSIPRAGLLVSGYALGVVVGAPIVAVATAGLSRKAIMVGLMALFVVGNSLCALAPGYGAALFARFLTAFAHAAFFGIGSVIAAELAPEGRHARAVALLFTGMTLANVLGVPAGTFIGQEWGWRSVFVAIAAIGLLTMAAIAVLVPAMPARRNGGLVAEFRVLRDSQVVLGLALSAAQAACTFAVLTYITPILVTVTGIAERGIGIMLLVFGVGLTLGNLLGGRLADWRLMPSVTASFLSLTLLFALFVWTSAAAIPAAATIFLWGVLTFALVPPLQMNAVRKAALAPNLGSTINQAAFHVGCAGGAWAGSLPLQSGMPYPAVIWLGAGLALAGFLLSLLSPDGIMRSYLRADSAAQ